MTTVLVWLFEGVEPWAFTALVLLVIIAGVTSAVVEWRDHQRRRAARPGFPASERNRRW